VRAQGRLAYPQGLRVSEPGLAYPQGLCLRDSEIKIEPFAHGLVGKLSESRSRPLALGPAGTLLESQTLSQSQPLALLGANRAKQRAGGTTSADNGGACLGCCGPGQHLCPRAGEAQGWGRGLEGQLKGECDPGVQQPHHQVR